MASSKLTAGTNTSIKGWIKRAQVEETAYAIITRGMPQHFRCVIFSDTTKGSGQTYRSDVSAPS